MRSILGLAVIGILIALGSTDAAPARLLHRPSEPTPPPAPVMLDLNGTTWLGKYMAANRTFIFEADGTLSYKSAAKTAKAFKNRGFWKLEGNKLYFEHYINPNQKLMEFHGVIKDGNTIVGEATFLGSSGFLVGKKIR
jgi:hypothetical protein